MVAPGYRNAGTRKGKKFGQDTHGPNEPRYGLDGGDGTFGGDIAGPGEKTGGDIRRPGQPKRGGDIKKPGQGRNGGDTWGR